MIWLLNIDKPEELTEDEHKQILYFMWNLITDSEWVKIHKNIFAYWDTRYKLLDKWLWTKSKLWDKIFNAKTRWLAKFMMWDEIEIRLVWKSVKERNVKVYNILHTKYLYPFFKDKKTVSDHILSLWYELFKNIWIQFINWELNLFFNKNPNPYYKIQYYNAFEFDYYNQLTKEDILNKEIELGYTNKTIWDPNRSYAYSHLLRWNMWDTMAIPTWSIKMLMWWSQINIWVTSRKQGKTSKAWEMIVNELLCEKTWYGMRKYRMIRFFTDNATKIWGQVMDYIEDYLWDLIDKNLDNGKPYFKINRNDQKVICNLTWNKFEVNSIRSLTGGNTDKSDGDWLACDAAIIDEWFRMPERFWTSFTDRAFDECDWILLISTMNDETIIDHWLYDEFIKWESWWFSNYNSIRSWATEDCVIFYNNHIIPYFFDTKNKLIKKEIYYKYRTKPSEVYEWDTFRKIRNNFDLKIQEKVDDTLDRNNEIYVLKRLFCSFFSNKKIFDVNWRITWWSDIATDDDYRFIWYDMASLSDSVWRVIINWRTLVIEEWKKLWSLDYNSILDDAKKMKEKYTNCMIVWDRWWPIWETVAMNDTELTIDYWVKMTSNINWVNRKTDSLWKEYYTVNKWTCFLSWSDALSNIFKILYSCTDLIEQFGRIEAKKSEKSTTVFYRGKKKDWKKDDDVVLSYVNIIALIRLLLWLDNKEEIKDFSSNSMYKILDIYEEDDYNENNLYWSFNY